MKNTQKGFIAPLLIAIIVVLAIGGGVYYYSWNKSTPIDTSVSVDTQPTSTLKNDTVPNAITQITDWKTYTDKQNDFSVQYPQNWATEKVVGNSDAIVLFVDPTQKVKDGTDQPRDIVLVANDSSCNAHDWEIGFGLANWKKICVTPKISITLEANTKTAQILEDQILSTFKFTTPITQSSITILSPNGGTFQTGSVVAIKWTGGNSTGKVRILTAPWETKDSNMKGSFYYIADAVSNNGSYSWTVPNVSSLDKYQSTLGLSGQYFIRIDCYQSCGGTIDNPVLIGETSKPINLTLENK